MASGDSSDTDLVPVSARAPQPEQRLFGRFTLKRVLGRGGMGIVWLAEDEELQRNVAMKFLPDMLIRDPDAVKDLKRETRRSLDLTHHHIVRIYDFIQDDSSAAIVMEYVDGESLSAMKSKKQGGCFGPSEIAHWVAHFCMAMDYAHNQARVVHRDLKPANLMVNSRSELKVTDFGISRSLSDSMTRVSLANNAGTLAYMSPEQALGSPPAPADDIYAFGATLYDLLTGRPPFFRGNLQVQLETVMPPPLMHRRAELDNSAEDIPANWEEVIMACLSKRPEDRPSTLGEVGHRLGILGTTGSRPIAASGGADSSRTVPGTSPTALTVDATPTLSGTPPETSRPTGRGKPGTAPATTLDDILSHGVERPVPPTSTRKPATQPPAQPQVEPDLTMPGTPLQESAAAPPHPTAPTASSPLSSLEPANLAAGGTSSPAESYSAPLASSSRKGAPWLWIGAAGVVVLAIAGALALPKRHDSNVTAVGPAPNPPLTSAVPPGPAPVPVSEAPVPAPVPTAPAPDPAVAEAEQHALAAGRALDNDDLPKAKEEIAALKQLKSDHSALTSLNERLTTAEKASEVRIRRLNFQRFTAAAQKAIDDRDIPGARDSIAKAAAIQDDDEVANLRKALAKLDTPPATPAPAPAPSATAKVEPPEPTPRPKPTASTTTRQQEPKRREDPPPKRTVQTQPPPEPRATPKPAQTTTTTRQQPPAPSTPKKVFSIPGS